MKGKLAVLKDKIAAMLVMLAQTGVSLPGSAIRPPARTVRNIESSELSKLKD
jgi:hypothetical protein